MERGRKLESKQYKSAQNIEKCFSGEGQLNTTLSANGNKRIRAFIPDEDGYAGWVTNSSYVGIVELIYEGKAKYIAERHFPNAKGKPTYLWELNPETEELWISRQDGEGDTPQLNIPILADSEHVGYFLSLTQDMAYAYSFNDYELKATHDSDIYTFKLEDLQ